ncbi:MAG: HNH endonuclease [Gemmatimonadetes bacterium]|nr:HNH endonuclease [Gemmatimonadota bacterium]
MDAATRDRVRGRAADRCEYCRLVQQHSELTHHIEHIVARQHGGADDLDNLALACHRCNLHKGPNLTGIDPLTGQIVPLFHPRRDEWQQHFRARGAYLEGLTPSGRATVRLLAMNDPRRLELRSELLAHGERPF